MLFGKGGYLGDMYTPIDKGSAYEETLVARDRHQHVNFADEKSFFLTQNFGSNGSVLIYADCDKF
jgi:hypothetical protein